MFNTNLTEKNSYIVHDEVSHHGFIGVRFFTTVLLEGSLGVKRHASCCTYRRWSQVLKTSEPTSMSRSGPERFPWSHRPPEARDGRWDVHRLMFGILIFGVFETTQFWSQLNPNWFMEILGKLSFCQSWSEWSVCRVKLWADVNAKFSKCWFVEENKTSFPYSRGWLNMESVPRIRVFSSCSINHSKGHTVAFECHSLISYHCICMMATFIIIDTGCVVKEM